MKTPTLALALVVVLALDGCSSSPTPVAPSGSAGSASSPATATTAAPASSPTATVHKFGESAALGTVVVATVYGYTQPVAAKAPRPAQDGYTWAAADVKVCAGTGAGDTGKGITVSHDPWALRYDDDSLIQPSGTGYVTFPQPEFPWEGRPLEWGRCVRGWITFAVPAGKRPTMVEYQPKAGSTVAGMTVDWTVSR